MLCSKIKYSDTITLSRSKTKYSQ